MSAISQFLGALTNTPSINGGAVSGMKNRCINGMMEVSQRGDFTTASASVSGTYYLDRWFTDHTVACNKQQTTGNSVTNLGASCKAFKLIATATSVASTMGIRQKYEWFSELSGKQITISAYVKSNSTNARVGAYCATTNQFIYSSAHSGSGNFEKLSVTATVTAGLTVFYMDVIIGSSTYGNVAITSGDYIEATGFQLKDGDCRNELYNEWRPYPIEEILCKRYFEKSYAVNVPPGTVTYSGCVYAYASTANLAVPAPFKVDKRALPTMTYYSATTGAAGYVRNADSLADVAASEGGVGGLTGSYICTVGGFSAGQRAIGHWTASAEL